jgi:hypothetical protein
MFRRYDKWSVPIIRILTSHGFRRDAKAVPRSIFVFHRHRDGVTVELRGCHLMRVLRNGGIREYSNVSVGEALQIIQAR